jgi:ATP-dependent RNA helicase DeaD
MTSFEDLGLRPELVQAITEMGYEAPTPIQEGAIPALLAGGDVLGQAQTGTGKTAAFALPMLSNLDYNRGGVQAIVLAPTRELAIQVSDNIFKYGRGLGVRTATIYGGTSYARQTKKLEEANYGRPMVVVGTPGRTLDLLNQGALKLSDVRYLVLDEADEMLKMGFIDDVETILNATPTDRQTALFSATLADPIRRLAEKYMRDPQLIAIENKTRTVPQTEQRYYFLDEDSKLGAVARLLEVEDVTSALIFTRTKLGAAKLAETLISRHFPVEALHGDMSQEARESVLRRFRRGAVRVLVATDVMSRGLDIQDVSHVINFDMPYDAEDYVHRIGRTGRAGREGVAITLVTPRERRWLKVIEQYIGRQIPRATLPTPEQVLARRDERFKAQVDEVLADPTLARELSIVQDMIEAGHDASAVAAAAIRLARANELSRPIDPIRELSETRPRRESDRNGRYGGRSSGRREYGSDIREGERPRFGGRARREQEAGMVRLMFSLGRAHGIQPGDVVGAIASEAGIPGRAIGAIDIRQNETYVDVKEAHAEKVLRNMERAKLRGQSTSLRKAK